MSSTRPSCTRRYASVVCLLCCLLTTGGALAFPLEVTRQRNEFARCGRKQKCRFRLVNAVTRAPQRFSTFTLSAPNSARGPVLIRKGSAIRFVLKVGEALISNDKGKTTPISKFRPKGMRPRLARDFLKVLRNKPANGTSIAKLPTRGNQHSFLSNQCTILPIREYEEVKGGRIRKIRTRNSQDCVAFVMRANKVLVELLWDSGDDLDLALKIPGLGELSNENFRLGDGRLVGDNNEGFCGRVNFGRERIVFQAGSTVPSGEYTVIVRQAANCDSRTSTNFVVRVIVQGKIEKTLRRRINTKRGEVGRLKFKLSNV